MIRSSRQKSCGPARRHLAATRLACRLGVTNDKTQGVCFRTHRDQIPVGRSPVEPDYRAVIQGPDRGGRIMRYELSNEEWIAIKPMLPIVTIVGTGNDRQGITFHTNTKNTPSGQPEEGYTWHMKKTFSDKVRDIVRKIPKGKTMTYKEVASKAGNPKAARAVGAVMRSNYDPSIPCHRVVASDGKMRGYNRGARIR